MARLVLFVGFIVGIVLVLNLKSFKSIPVNSNKFDFEATKSKNIARKAELDELAKAKMEKLHAKVAVAAAEPAGPLVELTTPELKKGAELYQKCVVCHGKRGDGKKSQNAPKIGGQYAWYIEQQINNMKEKVRINKVMDPYIKKLTSEDIRNVAEYISKLPW